MGSLEHVHADVARKQAVARQASYAQPSTCCKNVRDRACAG